MDTNMNRIMPIIASAALILLTVGCIETHLLVTVRPDGSGTIQETLKMNSEVLLPLMQMAQAMNETQEGEAGAVSDPPPPPPPPMDLFSEKDIRDRAAAHGKDVWYVSHELVDDGTKRGYNAEYAFKDISKLNLNSNPASSLPEFPGETTEGGDDAEDFVLFSFTRGRPAKLIIRPPAMDKADKAEVEEPAAPEAETQTADSSISIDETAAGEQMKRIFQEMRVSIRVKVDGDIVSSNATYRDGDVITILDIDFSSLMENEETMKQLEAMEDMDPAQMKDIIARIPGLKFDTAKEIEVLFK